MLLRGITGEPNAHQSCKVSMYYMELQTEISAKITKLTEIHSDIATQYAEIIIKVDYVNRIAVIVYLGDLLKEFEKVRGT